MGLPGQQWEGPLPPSGFLLGADSSHSESWEMTQRQPSSLCLPPPPYLLDKLFWSCTTQGRTCLPLKGGSFDQKLKKHLKGKVEALLYLLNGNAESQQQLFFPFQFWILPSILGSSILYILSDDQWETISAWIYGFGLSSLFIVSTIFHTISWKKRHLRYHPCLLRAGEGGEGPGSPQFCDPSVHPAGLWSTACTCLTGW